MTAEEILSKNFPPRELKDTLKYITGSNEFNWNLHVPDAKGFEGMIMWSGPLRGP